MQILVRVSKLFECLFNYGYTSSPHNFSDIQGVGDQAGLLSLLLDRGRNALYLSFSA